MQTLDTLDFGLWALGFGLWTLDFGHFGHFGLWALDTLDFGIDSEFRIQKSDLWMEGPFGGTFWLDLSDGRIFGTFGTFELFGPLYLLDGHWNFWNFGPLGFGSFWTYDRLGLLKMDGRTFLLELS